MTHTTIDTIADYARQVRAHLADLGPQVVEDLTDGLEADLAEALADAGAFPAPTVFAPRPDAVGPGPSGALGADLLARFGTPATYAAELRAAAGVSPAASAPAQGRRTWASLGAALRAWALDTVQPITSAPRWPVVRDFFVSLRPAWWIARGWLLGALVLTVLTDGSGRFDHAYAASGPLVPSGPPELAVMLAAVVVSVQYGRGQWVPRGRWGTVGVLASAAAAVALLPASITVADHANRIETRYEYVDNTDYSATPASVGGDRNALISGGVRVRNLFVYGPDGEYIDGAQITDQDGRPLLLTPEGSMWERNDQTGEELSSYWVPREDVNGRQVWNAYPLGYWNSNMAQWDDDAQDWFLPAGFDPWPKAPSIAKLAALRPLADTQGVVDDVPDFGEPDDETVRGTQGDTGAQGGATTGDAEPGDEDPDGTPAPTPSDEPGSTVTPSDKPSAPSGTPDPTSAGKATKAPSSTATERSAVPRTTPVPQPITPVKVAVPQGSAAAR